MTITVEMPDGGTAEFPDGMDPTAIEGVIKKHRADNPSVSEDITKVAPGAAGLGLANILSNVLPLPGAQQLLANAPEAISRKLTGHGLYEAKTLPGKIVDKSLQYAPAAIGPETMAGKLASTVLPAAAGTLASEGAKAAGMPEYADAAETATTLLSPMGIGALTRPFALKAARAGLLNTDEIKAARDSVYKKADEAGVLIKPESYRKFATDMVDTLKKKQYDLQDASSRTAGILTKIVDRTKSDRPQSLGELHTISERIGELIDSPDGTTRGLGKLMYAKIQGYKKSLTAKDVITPNGIDPQMAVQLEREGDALHGRFKKSQQLDTIYRKAKNRGANYSVAGEATGIRQRFRALADKFANPDSPEARYFTKEEQDAIEKVARGGFVQNRVRDLSKLSLNNIAGIGLAPIASGIGFAMGGPLGAGIGSMAPTIASMPFKLAENLWTKANANRVSDIIRGGKKLDIKKHKYPLGLLSAYLNDQNR